jgi:DNA-binding response OmpR family regulator
MPDQALIMLVEDEEHIAQGLLFNLEAEGYRTHHEADGDAALAWLLAAPEQPAAVLLDVMLPGRDGFSILRELREAGLYTPVLMLTARGRTEDIVEGFEAGADDYVAKPFDLGVLIARLASLLRRVHWHSPATPENVPAEPPEPRDEYVLGDRTICFDTLEIHAPGKVIHLTLMEADLLRYLIERPGKIISRKEILENVWRVHEDTDTRAIDNFIVRLRRHLEPDPSKPAHLLTVRGIGYRFMTGEAVAS